MKRGLSGEDDYELWVLLHQTRDAIFRARESELRKFGITAMQAAVLFIIKAIQGPATPAEIARWLFREHHTVSSLLIRMEKEGLVKKTKGRQRRNMIEVTLTKKGEATYIRSRELVSIHNIMSSLSLGERAGLKRHLEILRSRATRELAANKPVDLFPYP